MLGDIWYTAWLEAPEDVYLKRQLEMRKGEQAGERRNDCASARKWPPRSLAAKCDRGLCSNQNCVDGATGLTQAAGPQYGQAHPFTRAARGLH